MTPETKQRIEQIHRGEVPEGYKATKIAIFPKEWKTVRLKKQFIRQTKKKHREEHKCSYNLCTAWFD